MPVSGKVNLDAVLSVVQMPPGIPVATVGINGSKNAALLAVSILSISDDEIHSKLKDYRKRMEKDSMAKNENIDS